MISATRLKNLRKRVRAANEEKRLAGDFPTDVERWRNMPYFKKGVQFFREHVGNPVDTFGEDWEPFFLPWEVMIPSWYEVPELVELFTQHQKEDGGKSWSFGEMVVREEIAERAA
ncbi:hypothetical protein KE423_003895 [Salmonella enterica]|nr:hypothetical protein [Salmonella enterica]